MRYLRTSEKQQLAAASQADGLYRKAAEHDACGMGFVAHIKGQKSHEIIQQALTVLMNLSHRGACGCDPDSGDGAGIMIQIPHEFFLDELHAQGIALPEAGRYGVGQVFLPQLESERALCEEAFARVVADEGQRLIGWRDVPVNPEHCGWLARETLPVIRQVFVAPSGDTDIEALERKLYVVRCQVENAVRAAGIDERFFICSLSHRTIVYKGLLIPHQIPGFYPDLDDTRMKSALALIHSRFSTNTFPSWSRAHPFRYICHNGEINTLRGNVNWMHARQSQFASERFGTDIEKLLPVISPNGSDSEGFDNGLELVTHTGRSLPHAVMMMIPEAWQHHDAMSDSKRAFYEYHATIMEPWDGPASIAFTDGVVVGAVLDRNGLRPSRYVVTKDDLVVMASEVGVLDIAPERIAFKSRLEPGRMFLVDTAQGRIVDDSEIKEGMAARQPYRQWLEGNLVHLDRLAPVDVSMLPPVLDQTTLLTRHRVHGYTREDVQHLIKTMAQNGEESIGSMGNDTPLAVLSDRPQILFNYFKQLFAQVTNPPIDPLREDLVMSLGSYLGAQKNLFGESPAHCHQLALEEPVLTNEALQAIKHIGVGRLSCATLPTLFKNADGGVGLRTALETLCANAEHAIDRGVSILVLSDRGHDKTLAPIPSLLATAAVHHHLIRKGKRTLCGIVVEAGDAREVMHLCLLLGYGAGAINPYLAYETIQSLAADGHLKEIVADDGIANYIKAACKGVKKVMSKMGISTLQSYSGAQIFEAIGLNQELIDQYFTWTASRIQGIGIEEIAAECSVRHHVAHEIPTLFNTELDPGGTYQWRRRGEYHMYNPDTVASLQHAVRSANFDLFKKYSSKVNLQNHQLCTIRGLLEFTAGASVPIGEVESAAEIVKRFKTGAMSYGSISKEAHETIAIAMNRIGARSNTGEGGEDPARYVPDANGDSRRSAIKQVASGRFGVTSFYLVNSDELQIKIAQGAKPGEGGQLPGHKVDDAIARVRYSTPGVGLISPPPHHDIYSIEDLAQLIHDLKNANDQARISVKLVSEVGVGTIAAGVAKAKADLVLISGDVGGTGASPLTSIKHAGAPWELGLAETQQTLVINDLRRRIRVETDGHLKTGRDVAVACLLGAEEFGFGTSALVASGCILMRVCHLNTCPVGVATQDPELRKRFKGQPEHIINYMFFLAEELREIMAELGFRKVEDMVGRVDRLEPKKAIEHWKAKGLDLSPMLHMPAIPDGMPLHQVEAQDHGLVGALDYELIKLSASALESRMPVRIAKKITNTNRTTCTMLSSEISRRHGLAGLPPETISIEFTGSAGQSFCAFMANGLSVKLYGEANDYVGKGLSGGRVVIMPPKAATFVAADNIIAGNVVLYGATGGELYLRGRAGERFAVRNSGAVAVVEGIGDHGCEYMTRGVVVVLGSTGRNFAAGMSGGVAYVLDVDDKFESRCNTAMVELEPIDAISEVELKVLIGKHRDYAGSERADEILSDWERYRQRFVRVMPTEYKKVVAKMKIDSEMVRLATV